MSVSNILTLLRSPKLDLDALERALDAASHADRMEVLDALSPRLQRALWDAAQGRAITLDHFVPPSTPPMRPVIHEGINTLPSFRHFQKRFCKPSAPSAREQLIGYNHQTFSAATGPGYFVCYEDQPSGEVWIDYRELPTERPESWPKLKPNSDRLGRLVYHGMVDRMRRVSQHVSIGRAYKKAPMSAWFVLVRRP